MATQQQYRIVVTGELGARYASAFEGMTIRAHDGITEMTGSIIDPAHLHALIDRIAGLGLTLHSLTPVDTENVEAAAAVRNQRNLTHDDDTRDAQSVDWLSW
jgi:hypothetical protein